MTQDGKLAPPLRQFLLWLLGLLAICFAVELVRGGLLHRAEGTYSSFLYQGWFPDLLMHTERFKHFHSPGFFSFASADAFMYPAPVAVMYQLFYAAPGGPVVAYLALAIVTLATFCGVFTKGLVVRGVALTDALPFVVGVLLCSYPVLFMIKQGNMELVIMLILMSGIALFLTGRGYAAAICFAVAASLKIYPFVFFGLFLRRGQVSKIVLGATVFSVSELASLWLVCPRFEVSWRGINDGLAIFREICMVPIRPEIGADHSLYAWIKLLQRLWHIHHGDVHFDPATASHLTLYLATTAVAGVALFVTYLRKMPITNQILCLTLASVWLPPVSFEYTLVQLLTPMGMLMLLVTDAWEQRREHIAGAAWALAGFLVILGAFPELALKGNPHGGQLKSIAILALFGISLRYPFAERAADVNGRAGQAWMTRRARDLGLMKADTVGQTGVILSRSR